MHAVGPTLVINHTEVGRLLDLVTAGRGVRRLLPLGASAAALLVGIAQSLTWVIAIAAVLVLGTAPIARRIGSRVMLATIWGLFTAGAVSHLPVTAVGKGTVLLAVTASVLACASIATARRGVPIRPQFGAQDLLVGASVAILGAFLVAPVLGHGDERVVVDLAPGLDDVNHYAAIWAIIHGPAEDAALLDGSLPVMHGYPPGFHTLAALLIAALYPEPMPAVLVRQYFFASAALTALSAAVLGWLALDICRRAFPKEPPAQRHAALVFLLATPLGGMFVSYFVLGHVGYLLAVVVAAAGSWLALRSTGDGLWTAGIVGIVAAAGVVWTYPSVAAGLAPAIVILCSRFLRRTAPELRWTVTALGMACVVALGAERWFSPGFAAAITQGAGQNAAPPAALMLGIGLGLLTSYVAVRVGSRGAVVLSSLASAIGLAALAATLAALVVSTGEVVGPSYYLWKTVAAAWVAAFPVVVGLLGGVIATSSGRVEGLRRRATLAVSLCVLGGLSIAAVPHLYASPGRGPEGLLALSTRMWAFGSDEGGAGLVADASEVEAGPRDAVLVASVPHWWGQPFMASLWVNALRGRPTDNQWKAAWCQDQPSWKAAEPCLREWLEATNGSLVVLVTPDQFELREALARDYPNQVRFVQATPADLNVGQLRSPGETSST